MIIVIDTPKSLKTDKFYELMEKLPAALDAEPFILPDVKEDTASVVVKSLEQLSNQNKVFLVGPSLLEVANKYPEALHRAKFGGVILVNIVDSYIASQSTDAMEYESAMELLTLSYPKIEAFTTDLQGGADEAVKTIKRFVMHQQAIMREERNSESIYMELASSIAMRSTCLRQHVGAVLVKNNMVVSTGYNGAPRNTEHCLKLGCLREELGIPSGKDLDMCRAVHAEQNAILQAARNNVSTDGGVMYCTLLPCITCAKIMINAGIKKVVYKHEYTEQHGKEMLKSAGVEVVQLSE